MKPLSNLSRSKTHAFSLIEIMGVLVLLALLYGVVFGGFSPRDARIRKAGYEVTRQLQASYIQTLKSASVHRMVFNLEEGLYTLEKFEPPKPKPELDPQDPQNEEILKAIEAWEKEQEAYKELPIEKRTSMTLIDRGSFKSVSQKKLPAGITFKQVFKAKTEDSGDDAKRPPSILFLPTGEAEAAAIVLTIEDQEFFSLEVEPLTGRVRAQRGEITEEEWKKKVNPK